MRNLTGADRQEVALFLLKTWHEGKLGHGAIKEAAAKWNVDRKTIYVIWSRAKASLLDGKLNVQSKRFGNTNHKRILPDLEFIKSLKFSERGSIEKISKQVNVSIATVHSWVINGLLKPHSSPLHPQLTEVNKVNRVKFCLNALAVHQTVDETDKHTPRVMFKDMSNTVHIDEKWFYLSRANQRYYVVEGEELPYRSCKSKRFITKVMFMCAVSRPVYSEDGELLFDGKIGMFPFTSLEPAQRRSKNRAASTLELKAIDSITKEVTRKCIIETIIPAIKAKWPPTADKHIFIQQDNARAHISNNDPEFRQAATEDGFNFELVFQPPNSPDLNTNDLGFFRAIQSLQAETAATNVQQLVAAVEKAFTDYSPYKLNKIFLTLQTVMVQILKAKGHNNFGIPHMRKDHLHAQGLLPTNLNVDEALVRECIDMLVASGDISDLDAIMDDLGYLNVE